MLANTLLANTLAVLLGLGSFTFYMAAFFYPEVHRRTDFLWSGLGLFYALVLWFCAGQMTGALLLGQMTAVILLMGLGWETLRLRREKTPVYQQTPIVLTPEVVGDWAKNKINQLRIAPAEPVPLRLAKRTLGSQRVDPRRRPVYDYEFVEDGELVEDGILEVTTESEALSLEALPVITAEPPLRELSRELSLEPDSEVFSESTGEAFSTLSDSLTTASEDPVPPSVEAEIISVESPEVEPESAVGEVGTGDIDASEIDAIALEPESQQPEPQKNEPTPVVATNLSTVSTAENGLDDEWGDTFFEEDFVAENPAAVSQATPIAKLPKQREKPNVLATPLILAEWVKDVVVSLTKPKPSKPVINIPRREPSSADSAREGSPQTPSPSTKMARAQQAVEDIEAETKADPILPESNWEESNWEESNWDD